MNQEIRCQNCGKVFKINESNYVAIVQQVQEQVKKKERQYLETRYEIEKRLENITRRILKVPEKLLRVNKKDKTQEMLRKITP